MDLFSDPVSALANSLFEPLAESVNAVHKVLLLNDHQKLNGIEVPPTAEAASKIGLGVGRRMEIRAQGAEEQKVPVSAF